MLFICTFDIRYLFVDCLFKYLFIPSSYHGISGKCFKKTSELFANYHTECVCATDNIAINTITRNDNHSYSSGEENITVENKNKKSLLIRQYVQKVNRSSSWLHVCWLQRCYKRFSTFDKVLLTKRL